METLLFLVTYITNLCGACIMKKKRKEERNKGIKE